MNTRLAKDSIEVQVFIEVQAGEDRQVWHFPQTLPHISPYYTTLDSYGLSLGVLLLLLALFLVVLSPMRRMEPPFIGGEEGVI